MMLLKYNGTTPSGYPWIVAIYMYYNVGTLPGLECISIVVFTQVA